MKAQIMIAGLIIVLLGMSACQINGNANQDTADNLVEMTYQPKQCEQTPWQKWYALGKVNFIKEPTESQLATTYYNSEYNISISGFTKVETDKITCMACNVCLTSYYYIANVSAGNADAMKADGWN